VAADGAPGAVPGTDAAPSLTTAREVGVELLHLWGLPAPIVSAVRGRDSAHEPSPAGLGVAGALRVAHLLIQQTDARDPADGEHEDELAHLLTHPQLTAQRKDWRGAAQEAAAHADRWLEP
jgi:HD-like signal output (HDOD) protein